MNQRKAVLRLATGNRQWLDGFCREAVRLLQTQQHALPGEPLKLLHVAGDIKAARAAADAYNWVTGQGDFARLVTSDQPDALKTLRAAARENRSCAIVAVKMVTEGFDCPQVATIAYATNVTADLFIAQTMARAMRITGGERAEKRMLPAQVLIPDNLELRKAFAAAMQATMHEVEDRDEDNTIGIGSGEGTDASSRTVMLTDEIAQELDVLRQRQEAARAAAGEAWTDTGFVFTRADGTHLHPAWASGWFKQLAREAGLPPIRLHDLRHGAASLMLAAGVDIKVVADVLGHSSTGITRDIYTSVFAPLKWQAIDAVAALLAANRPTAPTTPTRRQASRSTASTNRAGAHRRSRATTAGKENHTRLSKA